MWGGFSWGGAAWASQPQYGTPTPGHGAGGDFPEFETAQGGDRERGRSSGGDYGRLDPGPRPSGWSRGGDRQRGGVTGGDYPYGESSGGDRPTGGG